MEVHAHTHTPRKKWTHYFWEFLMLFLAVFCGFLAENIREHKVEHQRAKALAASLYADLKNDSTGIKGILMLRSMWNNDLDTLLNELERPMAAQNDTTIFFIAGSDLTSRIYFVPVSGTYDQIKQSGYLRYFKQNIASALVQYESDRNLLAQKLDIENKFVMENIIPFTIKNLNQKYLRNPDWKNFTLNKGEMMPKDYVFQHELYGLTKFLLERSRIYTSTLKEIDSLAGVCLTLLKKEYHLK